MSRRMQGRLGVRPLLLVAAVAASLTTACNLPAGGDDSADFAQVCTDASGNAEPDSDCDSAPVDFQSDAYPAGRTYMWRYYPASSLVIPAYGQRMPSGGSLRRPAVITVPGGAAGGSAGSTRPAKIATPSAGSSGGALTKTGSSSSISRGGFGVKGGGSTGGGKSGSGSVGA